MKKYLGIIALAIGAIGAGICFASGIGIVFLVIGLIVACADIYLGFKEENLTFQEYLRIAPKEKKFSVACIILIVIFSIFVPHILANLAYQETLENYETAINGLF